MEILSNMQPGKTRSDRINMVREQDFTAFLAE